MTFATLAAKETTALAERLAAAAAKELDALRADLTARHDQAAAALAKAEAAAAARANDLVAALARAETAETLVLEHETEIASTKVRAETAETLALERDTQLATITARAEAAETLARQHEDALASAIARVELAETTARQYETDTTMALTRLEAEARDRESELAAAVARADARAHEFEGELEQSRRTLESARNDIARMTDEIDRRLEQEITLSEELTAARAAHRGPLMDRLHTAFEQIADGRSIDDVLTAAADGLAEDFTRVAVLGVKDNRLAAGHHFGFDENSAIAKVVVPLTVDSLLTKAAASNDVQTWSGDAIADAAGAPFGGSPSFIVTAPIRVRGEVLGVIYADDSGRSETTPIAEDSVKLADVLRHFTVARLERLTVELKTIAELRAYAEMLLDEVQYVYAADASGGKNDSEKQDRLQENLRCARQIYEQRVSTEGPAAAKLLEEQIAAMIKAKSETPFGRDLAVVATRPEAGHAKPEKPSKAARAS